MFSRLVDELRFLVAGSFAALLPQPENRAFAWRQGLDVVPFSLALGIVQVIAGPLLFFFGGLAFLGHIESQGMILLENWWPGLGGHHLMGMGLLNWIAWFLHPLAWIDIVISVTGCARCAAYIASREAIGEPWMWVVVRAWQFGRKTQWQVRKQHALGPVREDRISREEAEILTILTSRERPEWSEAITLQFGQQHYRLLDARERSDGTWRVLAYRFRPARENELVRRLVRYQPLAVD